MTNLEKYNQVFVECLEITESALNADLIYNSVEQWDSIGHMAMIAELEDTFDIMIDTEDVIDFSSYEKGKDILAKYDVEL